jgi:hypothetical protein
MMMMMKATAARLIQASGSYSPSVPPTATPMADTQARAIDAPMSPPHGRPGLRRQLGFVSQLGQKDHAECRQYHTPIHLFSPA